MRKQNDIEKNKSKSKWIILLLLLLISICINIWLLFFRNDKGTLVPDHAPDEVEQNQQTIDGDNNDKAESTNGDGTVNIDYSNKAVIDLSNETLSLYFANTSKSNNDLLIQLIIQDEVIVQSGKITSGHQVTILDLLDNSSKRLTKGDYNGKFMIFYYDSETGQKSVVNTEIPVTVTVIE